MAWGNSFDKPDLIDPQKIYSHSTKAEAEFMKGSKTPWHIGSNTLVREYETLSPSWVGVDLGSGERQATALIKDGRVEKVYDNKVPTHDPYTNPNAHIYYECGCGAILDPGTKRFAELNNCASKAGWKIRFSDSGYVPYCVECGKGVE